MLTITLQTHFVYIIYIVDGQSLLILYCANYTFLTELDLELELDLDLDFVIYARVVSKQPR